MKKIIYITAVLALLIISYFLLNKQDQSKEKVLKIGAALPLTGELASFGEEFKRGAEVAQDEINGNDKIVRVIFEDTALETKKSVDAVMKLVNVDGIDALFVSAYGEAAVTHDITDRKNIPLIVLWDSNPQLEAMGDKVFALGPWTPASGEITADFVYKKGMKRAAIFGYKQEWSIAVSEAFTNKFKKLGGVITTLEYANPGATDYRTEATKIILSNPDVVYVTVEDFLKGVKQIKELGYKGVIITSDLLDNSQIELNPTLFEGVYGSQVADPAVPEILHYIDLYKKKFGENPKKILYSAWGYDAVHLFYKAYSDQPNKKITEGLYKVGYKGASGEIKFDNNGTSKTIPKMFIVKNGAITKVD